MKLMKRQDLQTREGGYFLTKGELLERMYPNCTFDTSVPMDLPVLRLLDVGELAMGYANHDDKEAKRLCGVFGVPLPLVQEAAAVLLRDSNEPELLKEIWKRFGLEL